MTTNIQALEENRAYKRKDKIIHIDQDDVTQVYYVDEQQFRENDENQEYAKASFGSFLFQFGDDKANALDKNLEELTTKVLQYSTNQYAAANEQDDMEKTIQALCERLPIQYRSHEGFLEYLINKLRFLVVRKRYTNNFMTFLKFFAFDVHSADDRNDKERFDWKKNPHAVCQNENDWYDSRKFGLLSKYFQKVTKQEKNAILDAEIFEAKYNEIHSEYPLTAYKKSIYNQMLKVVGDYENTREDYELDIPKGKKLNQREDYMHCAKRELHEETGIPRDEIHFVNKKPFIIKIRGFDNRIYRYSFFMARKTRVECQSTYQKRVDERKKQQEECYKETVGEEYVTCAQLAQSIDNIFLYHVIYDLLRQLAQCVTSKTREIQKKKTDRSGMEQYRRIIL